ncbi:DUF3325 family protein [Massilia sp. CFBP9012]|uniref:DUF3325 family protein n=1 Tax=Massilia sp. CFBP9012 TaxID=3096531 RepID=UPI002A6AD74A|nr:DUF3325 family protein [Massilia sp. CFBP9012]MDY0977255.1 DUF3325 family protein [Massilia sp. CFBP9012]
MGWLNLSMDVQWKQVRGNTPCGPGLVKTLRVAGSAALASSFLLYLSVDSLSIATLVCFMATAGSTIAIDFTLTWRASALTMLVIWTGQDAR